MVSLLTSGFARWLVLLLCCWSFGLIQAQPVPAWLGAQAIGANRVAPSHMAVDAAGNTYTVSNYSGSTVVGGTTLTSQGYDDAYLAKFTAAGTLAWVFTLGSPGYESASGVALDLVGNVYLVGASTNLLTLGNNVSLSSTGSFLARFSSQGIPQWAQSVPASVYSIGLDQNDHLFAAGVFSGTITVGANTIGVPTSALPTGSCLARFSATTGAPQAVQAVCFYVSSGTGGATYTPNVTVAPTGEAYMQIIFGQRPIVGSDTLTSRGGTDVLLVKYTAQGTREWVRQYGGNNIDHLYRGAVDAAGNLYLAGYFYQSSLFGTIPQTSAGGYDAYLVKYSPQGAVQWVQTGGGTGLDVWYDLHLDAADNPCVAGSFFTAAQYGTAPLTSAGSNDIVVASYTPQGQLRWIQQAGSAASDEAYALGLDARGDTYVYGNFRGSCTFGSATLSPTATSTNFLARLGSSVLATRSGVFGPPLSAFPNPAHGSLFLPGLATNARVQLLDALGRVARETTVSTGAEVSVAGLSPGLYTLRTIDAQGRPRMGRAVVE